MARWTAGPEDERHIAKISNALSIFGRVRIRLKSGHTYEGVLRGQASGNNAGQGGTWAYYGNCELALDSGQTLNIDYLDIHNVTGQPWHLHPGC